MDSFTADHVESAITFVINAPPDEAFPLFNARREMEWDIGWRPVFLADETVFIVDHDFGQSTWVMTRYDTPERAVDYVRVAPKHTVAQIWIRVTAMKENRSEVRVTYRLTALSEAGNRFIARWQEEFPTKRQVWADVINHYVATGKALGTPYDVPA